MLGTTAQREGRTGLAGELSWGHFFVCSDSLAQASELAG